MKQYKLLFIASVALLLAGSTSPANSDKELIIRLQGEVLVLQRQIRDLQESIDKWQGQSTASLQKLSENTTDAARIVSALEDSLKNARLSQNNSLAGTNSQLQKISEQLSRQDQGLTNLSKEITNMKQSLRDYQQKMESRDTSVTGSSEETDDAIFRIAESYYRLAKYNEALKEYDRILSEHPKGDRALQSSLKRGITLLHLERRDEGVASLKSLIAQHPNSREASIARSELSRLGEDNSQATSTSSTSSTSGPPQNRQRP